MVRTVNYICTRTEYEVNNLLIQFDLYSFILNMLRLKVYTKANKIDAQAYKAQQQRMNERKMFQKGKKHTRTHHLHKPARGNESDGGCRVRNGDGKREREREEKRYEK